jgi:hypothetical protein
MSKLFAVLFATSLCACASVPAPKSVVVEPPVKEPSPLTVELRDGEGTASVFRCTDELDCMKKLTGVCANGFHGGHVLHAGNDRVVGTLFKCITDEEKAEHAAREAREAAEEKAWEEARAAKLAAAQAEAAKPATSSCQLPAKKTSKK